ncbi:Enoyl-(Acyl carrier protein) reductase [Ceratobasidium sp. AG-Ba]|nr:Enoyl-(Acyl carrier protein) reductase [Ceratobasidium sp. AG-Ba]QRW06461.1 Enoyl-(Acyl carrier protein) reductase [Ceratobasidium sp. AG-Ba]
MPLAIDFTGKTVMVSGGNRGIGAAIVKTFAEAGANIALLYNSGEAEATAHASKLTSEYKVQIRTYQCDTTIPARSAEVVELAAKEFGRLDVMVCNAGVCKHVEAVDTTEETVDWTLGVNVKGVFFLCQAAAKHWIAAKQPGSIVINSSMSANIINTPQRQAIYNASKAAASSLAKAFAFEWAPHNIRVNAVSPGYVATEMTAMGNPDMQKVWLERTPMGRMADPEEIGKSIAFIASEMSSYTTGSQLIVDGGYSVL